MSSKPAGAPTPLEVLRWCAASAPAFWYPGEHCLAHNLERSSLDEPLWILRQASLVLVADWVKGRGQGFSLTPLGQEILQQPHPARAIEVARQMPSAPETLLNPVISTEAPVEPTYYDRGETTRHAFYSPSTPVTLYLILWANVFWFLFCWSQASKDNIGSADFLKAPNGLFLVRLGAAFGPSVLMGEWWRLFSCAFVHIGLLHLLLNVLAIVSIGPVVETLFGRWRVGILYFCSALGATCLAVGLSPTAAIAGASGAIWGLMAAVLVWLIRCRAHLPADLAAENLQRVLVVIGFNAILSFAPNISWEGHLGGAITGALVSICLYYLEPGMRLVRKLCAALALLVIVALCVGFLLGMMQFSGKWSLFRSPQAYAAQALPGDTLNQLVKDVSIARVSELYSYCTVALNRESPSLLEACRNRTISTRNTADTLNVYLIRSNEPAAVKYRVYLAALHHFCDLLLDQIRIGNIDKPEQKIRLDETKRALDIAWDNVAAAQK
jgi:rhomboid protease GluP